MTYLGVKGSQVQILSSRRSDGRCPLVGGAAHSWVYLRKCCLKLILIASANDLYLASTLVVARQTGAKLERAVSAREMGSMIRSRFTGLFGRFRVGCGAFDAPVRRVARAEDDGMLTP